MQELKNLYYILISNFDYIGVLLLLFLAVVLSVFFVFTVLARRNNPITSRLAKLVRSEDAASDTADRVKFLEREPETLATKLSRPLHRLSAHNDRSLRNRLRLKLIQAGYRSDAAFYNFLAAKILLPVLLVVGVMIYLALYKVPPDMILTMLLMVIAGFFFPDAWVWLMMKTRQERIFKGLPDALDLMVVCVEAGLGLDMTFKRVGEEIRPLCKDLSDEFSLTTLEIRAGKSRDEAFKNMAIRANSREVNNLMTVLAQTSRFGTSLATALRVHADGMRVKRRQIAEETAAKSTVKLVFPLVLCIFPAIFVVVIGGGVIQIIKYLLPALGGH